MKVIEEGKIIRSYEPAPGSRVLHSAISSTTSAPSILTDGEQLDPHDGQVAIEVKIGGGDGTSNKAIKLWLLSRALNKWHDPEEGVVSDLHTRPGQVVFYVLVDAWLYERAYIQVTNNAGAGTISANIISR